MSDVDRTFSKLARGLVECAAGAVAICPEPSRAQPIPGRSERPSRPLVRCGNPAIGLGGDRDHRPARGEHGARRREDAEADAEGAYPQGCPAAGPLDEALPDQPGADEPEGEGGKVEAADRVGELELTLEIRSDGAEDIQEVAV